MTLPLTSYYGGDLPGQGISSTIDFPSFILWEDGSKMLWETGDKIEWANQTSGYTPDVEKFFSMPLTSYSGEAE
jgi:hypothetical protein